MQSIHSRQVGRTTVRKPNLFIIGAMKSGTSSLHSYLAMHPEIFMCEPKEPCYFVGRSQLDSPHIERLGLWRAEHLYLALFSQAGDAKVIGESSTLYTKAPRIGGVPERIAEFNRQSRFIYLMRDPVERTISHYWHMVRHHGETRDMLTAIRNTDEYRDVSHYAMQLDQYYRVFPPERVLTLTFEELTAAPQPVVARVFTWLGVDARFVPRNLGVHENATPEGVERVRGRGWLHRLRHSSFWERVGPWCPRPVRRIGRALSARQVDRKAEPVERVCHYLRPIQRDQVEALEAMLGRSFPEWTTLYGGSHSGHEPRSPSHAPVRSFFLQRSGGR